MMVSSRENSKKTKALSETDTTNVLEGQTIALMLEKYADTFSNMENYAKDLLEKRSIEDTSPKAILKMMLIEGWLDDEARICTNEGDKILIWKQ